MGYNFLYGLWKFQWDADCELFLRIILVGPGWGEAGYGRASLDRASRRPGREAEGSSPHRLASPRAAQTAIAYSACRQRGGRPGVSIVTSGGTAGVRTLERVLFV